ncbi:MAG: hypothetical protein WD135_04125 [Ferruginibacter sp.]
MNGTFFRASKNDCAGFEKQFKLIDKMEFKGKYCHFDYASIKMTDEYEVDGNYVYININNEIGILSMEIIDQGHLEGEGFIHGAFLISLV